jgi:hypothetical protein
MLYDVAPETAVHEQVAEVSVEVQLIEEGAAGGQAEVEVLPVFHPEQPPALHALTWKEYDVPHDSPVLEYDVPVLS